MRFLVVIFWMACWLPFSIYGQSAAFPTTDAEWHYHCSGDYGGFLFYGKQETLGDSIYNGLTYQKVSDPVTLLSSNGDGLLRSANEQVFFIPTDSLNELLLYDFSLQVGDTFFIDNYWAANTAFVTITGIDSLQTNDGVWRKRFYQSAGLGWIEGIGAVYGSLTYPWYFGSVSGNCYLDCFAVDSVLYVPPHHQGTVSTCGQLVTNKELRTLQKIKVYPNPFSEGIRIEGVPASVQCEITLLDLHSRVIHKAENTDYLKVYSHLPPGVYFLRITYGEEQYSQKLIKG